jgi:hypothetical protein
VRLLLDGVNRVGAVAKGMWVHEPFPVLALASLVARNGGVNGPPGPWLRDAAVIALGMRTMARASELAAVRLEDVRWAGDAVSVTLC